MVSPAHEAMQLRYLQTLTQIAGENSSTIVFSSPLDVASALKKLMSWPLRAGIPPSDEA